MRLTVMLAVAARAALAVVAASCAAGVESGQAPLHVVATYPGPDGGWDYTTFDPVHRRLYVSRATGVSALDVDTGTVTGVLVQGSRTHVALPINSGAEILVTNAGTGGVFIANALTGVVRTPLIATGAKPDAAMVEPTRGEVWVMDNGGGGIALIDPVAGVTVGKIAVDGDLESPATDGAGVVYVTVEDKGEIVVVDVPTRAVVRYIKLEGCEEPSGLAFVPEGRRLVAACANGVAKIVSADSGAIVATLPIGPRPDVAIYDPSRKRVFLPTGGDGMMSEIDVAHARVAGVVSTAMGARSIALDQRTGRFYLPSGRFQPPATPGGRPTLVPGTFAILAVGP